MLNYYILMCFSCRKLVTDAKVKLKYQHLITNSFVEVRLNIHPTFRDIWLI